MQVRHVKPARIDEADPDTDRYAQQARHHVYGRDGDGVGGGRRYRVVTELVSDVVSVGGIGEQNCLLLHL